VLVGERQFVGDPDTLFSLRKLSMSGHDIQISYWESAQGVNEVMQKLTAQLPDETFAWSDGELMRICWTTPEQSHVLVVAPAQVDRVSFFHSSIHTSVIQDIRSQASSRDLMKTLADPSLRAQRMMDVRDDSVDSEAISFLYISQLSIKNLAQKIRDSLTKNNWSVTEASKIQHHFFQEHSIDATRAGAILRIDLVDIGQSFLYVNLSGKLKP
jgi:hypothetical protein